MKGEPIMKRIWLITAILLIAFALTGCMYSRTVVVEDSASPSKDWSADAEKATNISVSSYLEKFIGIDCEERLISLNNTPQTTYITAMSLDKPNNSANIIVMDGITDAEIANHGKNIVFRTQTDSMTALYSYSIDTETYKKIYEQPTHNIKSKLYASAATDSVTDVLKVGGEYRIESFDLMTGKTTVYSISTNSLDNTLKYIVGSADIEAVFVDDANSAQRITVKAMSKVGSYVVSAEHNAKGDDIVSSEASTLAPQYANGSLYYTNKKNELMVLNVKSKTERRLAQNVKSFTVSSERASVAFVTTEDGSDKLYLLSDANSKAKLIDLRKGIGDITFSCSGDHLLVVYATASENSNEYLVYPIDYE